MIPEQTVWHHIAWNYTQKMNRQINPTPTQNTMNLFAQRC